MKGLLKKDLISSGLPLMKINKTVVLSDLTGEKGNGNACTRNSN